MRRSLLTSLSSIAIAIAGMMVVQAAAPAIAGATDSPTESTVLSGLTSPSAIGLDGSGHVYAVASGNVVRANIDGTGQTTIYAGTNATGLAVDASTDIVYTVIGGYLYSMAGDGTGLAKTNAAGGGDYVGTVGALASDNNGHVTWSSITGKWVCAVAGCLKGAYNGGSFTTLATGPQAIAMTPSGLTLAVDSGARAIYGYGTGWANSYLGQIQGGGLPGGVTTDGSGDAFSFSPIMSGFDIGLMPGLCTNNCGGWLFDSSVTTHTQGLAADASGATLFAAQTANGDGTGAGSLVQITNRHQSPTTFMTVGTYTTLASDLSRPTEVLADAFGHVFVNDAGNGRVVMVDLHTGIAPSAPSAVSAVGSGTQAAISWTAPSSGAKPWSYTATTSPGGRTCSYRVPASGTPSNTCTVTGLGYGTAYSFTVTASSGAGPSPASTPSSPVTLTSYPDAPVMTSAVAGDGQITVSWNPANANGSPITSYSAYAAANFQAWTCQSRVTSPEVDSCTIRALANGTTYRVSVSATNAIGTSSSSNVLSVTPAAMPGAPTNVSVTPANGRLVVTWIPPGSTGGSPITSYTATASPGGQSCTATVTTPESDTCTIANLTNGTGYTVTVRATTAVGTGPASVAAGPATPADAPGAPTSPAAVSGDAQATVSWGASASNGSPITGYVATANPGGQSCSTPDGVTTSCTVTGLTNGTTYTFTVAATNAAGTSSASAATDPVTPFKIAGAPSNVSAVAGNRALVVSWTPPSTDGGSPITSYRATASPGGATCTYTVASPETDTCTISSLTNGTRYTVTVVAINAKGQSASSVPSAGAIPKTAPAAPTAATATPGSSSIVASWMPPANNGGAAISSYKAVASPGSQSCTYTVSSPETDTCTIGGLVPGTSYSVTVVAANAAGKSGASLPSTTAIPFTTPGAPSGASLTTAGPGSLVASWNPPSITGYTTTLSYTATVAPGGQSCTYTVSSPETDMCTISGLTNGSPYTVSVTATNAAGTGPASGSSSGVAPIAPPAAPAAPSLTVAPNALVVAWQAPAANGRPITSYTATASPGGASCTSVVASPEVDTCTISGLANGTSYTVTVTATNAAGTGATSAPSQPLAPNAPPAAPRSVVATPAPGALVISWLAPTSNGGTAVTAYTATTSPGAKSCTYTVPGSGTPTNTCTITGLSAAQAYTVSVAATNVMGTGQAAITQAASPTAVPSAPTDAAARPWASGIIVSWLAPTSNGNSAITGYTATASPGGATCTYTVPGSGTPTNTCTITGLSVGQTYTATVTATNAVGSSVASAPSSGATTFGLPSSPTGVTQTSQGGTGIQVLWSPPQFTGGSPITSYTATLSPGGAQCTTTLVNYLTPSCTITGLTAGTTYTATVTASNVGGTGVTSLPSAPLKLDLAPNPPNNVGVTPGNGSLTVSWSAPTPNGGTPVTGYAATAYGVNTISCTTTGATSCTISNASPSGSYNVWVTASNAAGTSPIAVVSGVYALSIPAAPSGLTAVAGSSSITASWIPPTFTGNTKITSYTITASPGGRTCTATPPTTGPEADTCTITGLTPGTAYTLSASSTNVIGVGPSSGASGPATPFTTPGAPPAASMIATPAASSAIVGWSAPSSNGFSPLTSYTATATPGGRSCTTPDAATLTCTISGLTDGTRYLVTVAATNVAGTGPASSPGVPVTPQPTAPGPPTAVQTVAGSSQLQVSWTPGATGDSPITSTTAKASPGGATCSSAAGTSCTLTGLVPGTSYTVTVKATNALGTSSASIPSAAAIPFTVPGQISTVSIQAGSSSVSVSWDPPSTDGFTPITGYAVKAYSGGGVKLGGCTTTGATSCVVTGLSPGGPVNAVVIATNAAGSTSSVSSRYVSPYTTPAAPSRVAASALFQSLGVSWAAPTSDGGSPISGYTATASPGGASCTSAGATSCTITGLSNAQAYTVTVVASNAAGSSGPSTASSATRPQTTAPGPVGTPNVVAGSSLITVSWSYPAYDGGLGVTSYTATASPGGGRCTSAGGFSCVISQLTPGTGYTVTVTDTNALGSSPSSTASASATPFTTPSAPSAVSATQSGDNLSATWSAPGATGFSPLTGYVATASPGGATCQTSGATSCSISGLAAGTSYSVTVTASNAAGASPASTPSTGVTLIQAPTAPTGAAISWNGPGGTATDNAFTVSWISPATTARPVTGYTVTATASPGGGLSDTKACSTTGATSCTVTGLHATWTYAVSVVASNARGTSSPSTPTNGGAWVAPGAPTKISVASYGRTGTNLIVNWSPPANASAIIGGPLAYTATATPGGKTCSISALNLVASWGCVIGGLTPGTAYSVSVQLSVGVMDHVDQVMTSPASNAKSATPVGIPTAPSTPTVTSGSGQLVVSWTAPNANGAAITGYAAIASDSQGRTIGTCTSSGASTCTITGLTNLSTYDVSVTATNAVGTSDPSPRLTSMVAPTGFGVYVTSTVIIPQGGRFRATVAGAPANQPITVTFTGGASATCTSSAQGWCQVTSSAVSTGGTGKVTASYRIGGVATTAAGDKVAAPTASCSVNSGLQLASCSFSNTLNGGTVSYELDDASGNVLASHTWQSLSIDVSKLANTPGGTLYLYDRPAGTTSGSSSDVTIFTFTIRVTG